MIAPEVWNQPVPKWKMQQFQRLKSIHLLTSRFNKTTQKECEKFREQIRKRCVYCSPLQITSKIPKGAVVLVLEMNNETNQIIGIGMLRNIPQPRTFLVYETENYNRICYVGNHRIDRSEFTSEELTSIITLLEQLCFAGKSHLKRGQGITAFPLRKLCQSYDSCDIIETIMDMFRARKEEQEKTK
jgi:hypothetical protein